MHINSVFKGSDEGRESFHGRVKTAELEAIREILAGIHRHSGGVTLHRITKATADGSRFEEVDETFRLFNDHDSCSSAVFGIGMHVHRDLKFHHPNECESAVFISIVMI